MPELPEVETIVKGLRQKIVGKKIKHIEILDKKIIAQNKKKIPEELAEKIVKTIRRRAKMIVIELSNAKFIFDSPPQAAGNQKSGFQRGDPAPLVAVPPRRDEKGELGGVNFAKQNLPPQFILIHLKMTGQLVYRPMHGQIIAGGHPIKGIGRTLPNKFSRVIFVFNDGSKLYFNDVRRFGWIKLVDQGEFKKIGSELGIEPLTRQFTVERFKVILARKKNTAIKQVLMDQKYLVGVGNIYSDEALFAARIKPTRLAKTLSAVEIKNLWQAIPKILKYSIKHRGTSFNDYIDADGEAGNFIKYLKVYGREGESCYGCGGRITRSKIGGRSSHYCDKCQK